MESSDRHINISIAFGSILSVFVLAGLMFAYPSAVRNAANLSYVDALTVNYPLLYSLLAPFFQFADRITILSEKQLLILLAYTNAAWLIWRTTKCLKQRLSLGTIFRELIRFAGFNAVIILSVIMIVFIPRPEASITVNDPETVVLDFHTHTKYSWDGNDSATPFSQMEKRTHQGFNAFFITDHNNLLGAREAWKVYDKRGTHHMAIPLMGEEISVKPANLVVLGVGTAFSNSLSDKSGGSKKSKAFRVVAANRDTPDTFVYATSSTLWWKKREILKHLVKAGLGGIEIAKASPKGLNLTAVDRKKLVDFASRNGLVMLGSSDDHGFGFTGYVWNLVKLPGWRSLDPLSLERALINRIRQGGSGAVTVVTRIKAEPSGNLFLMSVDPLRQVWEMMRSLPNTQAAVFVAYAWMPFLGILLRRHFAIRRVLKSKRIPYGTRSPEGQPERQIAMLHRSSNQ